MVTVTIECDDCTDKCPYFKPNIWNVKEGKVTYGACEKMKCKGEVVDLMIFCPFNDDTVKRWTSYFTGTDYLKARIIQEGDMGKSEVESNQKECAKVKCNDDCKHYHQFFGGMIHCDKAGDYLLPHSIPYCPFHKNLNDDDGGLDIDIEISSPFKDKERYCQSCGAKNLTKHKYCSECGELLRPLQNNGALLKSFIKEEKENVCEECGNWDSVWDLCERGHNPQVKYSTDKPKTEHICFDCKNYQEKQGNKGYEKLIMIFLSIIIFILLMSH